MPVIRESLDEQAVRKAITQKGYGFVNVQGGWVVLNRASRVATRGDGTRRREPLPGRISPQVWNRILTYADSNDEAANQAIAMALGKVTDPVLSSEPAKGAPQMSLEDMERVIRANMGNEISTAIDAAVTPLRAENAELRRMLAERTASEAEAPKRRAKKGASGKVPTAEEVSKELGDPPVPPPVSPDRSDSILGG